MKNIENIEKFNPKVVKVQKKAEFVKQFEGRYPNADVIYDALKGAKAKEG